MGLRDHFISHTKDSPLEIDWLRKFRVTVFSGYDRLRDPSMFLCRRFVAANPRAKLIHFTI